MAMQQPPANSTESTSDAPAVSAVSTKPLDIDLIARVFQGYYFRKVTMGYLFLLTRIISLSAKILSPKHKKERSLFWIATKIPATLALIVNVGLIFFMSGLLIAFSSVMFVYQFAGNGLQSLLNIMGSKKTLNSPLPRALKDFSTINDRMLKRILAQIGSAVSKLLSILYTKGTTISPATIKASLTSVIKMIKQTPSLIFSTQASSDLSATAAPGIKLNVTALIGLLELSKTLVSPELFNLLCPPKDLSSPEAASPYLGIYPLMQEYFLNQTLAPKTQASTLLSILAKLKESSIFYDLIQAGNQTESEETVRFCLTLINSGTPPLFKENTETLLANQLRAIIRTTAAAHTKEAWMTQQRALFEPIIAAVTLMTADDNYDTTAAYIQKMSAPAPSPSESSPSGEAEAPASPLMPSGAEIALFTDIVDALAPCPLLSLATSGPVKELTQSLSTHLTNPSALTPVATLLEQFPAQITKNQGPILHAVTRVIRAFNDVEILDVTTEISYTLQDLINPSEPPKPPLTSIQKIDMMQALLTALEREPSDALFTALHRLQAALQPPALQPPSRDPALPFSSLIAPFIPQDLQIYSSFICTLCDHIMPTPCDSDAPPEETWQQHKSTLFTTLQKGIDLCKADPRLLDTLDLSSSSEATWSQKLLNAIFLKAPTTALSAASSLSASPGTSSMAAPDVETPLLTLPSVPFHQEQYFILTLEFFKAFLDKSKESDFFASTLTAVDRPLFQVMLDQMYPTTIDSPINPKSPTRAARTCLEHLYSSLQYSADFVANQTLCFQALSDMTQLTLNYEGDLQALWSPPVFPMNEEQTTYIKALFRCMDTVPLSLLYEIMLPMITPILHLTEHATLINLHKITNGDPTNIEKILSSFNKIRTLTLQYQGDLTALLRTPQFPLRTDQTQYLQDLAACLTELPWATLLMHAETQVVLNDLLELSGCAEELKRTILALQAHLAQHPKDLAALTQTETLSKVLTMLFHPNMQTLLRKTQDSTEVLPLNKTQQHAQCLLKILCDNDEHAFTELKTASYRIQRLHLSPSLLRARPTQPLTLSASLTPVDIENIIATLNAPDDYATWLSTFRSTYPDKAQDYLDAIITHYRSFVPTEIPGYSVTNAIIQTLHPNHIPSIGVLIQCVDSLIPTSSTLNHYSDTALVTPESMDGDNTPEESRVNGHKGLSAILASMVTGKQALPLIRGEEEAGAVPLVLHQFLRTMKEDSKIEFDFDSLDRHHPITSDDMTLELDDENEKKRVCMAKIIKNIQSLSDIDLIYKAKALDALYQSLSSLNPSKALPANLHTVSDADLRASLQDSSLTHLEYIQTTLANYIPKANLSRFLGAAIAPLLCPSESGSVNDRPPELMDFFQQIQNFYYSNPEDAETFLKQQFPQWDREKENFHLGLSHYFIALKYMHAKESELFSQFLQEQQEVLAQAQAQAQMLAFFCDATLLPEDKDLLDADLLSADPILLPVQAQRSTDTTHPPFKGIQAAIDHVLTKEIMNYNGLAGLLAQLDPHIISLLQAEYSHKPESIGLVALILEQFYHYDNPGQDSVFITNLLDYSLRNLDATHFHNLVHAVGTGEVNNIIYYLFVTQASLDHGPQHLNTESFNQDLFDKLLMNDPDRTAMFLAKTILFVLPSAKRLAPQELYDLENEIATDLSLLTKNPETFKSLAKGLFILMHPATERTPGHSKTEAIRMLVKGIKPLVERVPPATLLYHIIQSPDIKNSIIQACPQRLQTPILALFAQLGNKESDDRLMLQNILQFALDNSDNLVHNWPKCIVNAIAFLSSWGFSTALAATQEAAYTMAQETKEMGNDAYEAIQTATYTASFMATTLLSSTISACRGFFQASMPAIVQGTTQDLEMIPPLQAFAMIPSSESVPTQLKPQSTHKKSLIASEPSLPSPPLSNHRKKRERL